MTPKEPPVSPDPVAPTITTWAGTVQPLSWLLAQLDSYSKVMPHEPRAQWAMAEAAKVIRLYARAALPAGWVPVSERLPENTRPVLCTNGLWIGVARYCVECDELERWQDECGQCIDMMGCPKVSHWMPLPAAPDVHDGAER